MLGKKLVFSIIAFVISICTLSMSIFSFGWFAGKWGDSELQQNFSSAYPFAANLVMWTYDTSAEEGEEKWTCKYSDYGSSYNDLKEGKQIPSVGTFTTSSGKEYISVSAKDITFGEIDDLVNEKDENDVYIRLAFDTITKKGDSFKLEITLEENYAKCYGYKNTSSGAKYEDMTSSLNADLQVDNSSDNLNDFSKHRFFNMQYVIVPISYKSVGQITEEQYTSNSGTYYVESVDSTGNIVYVSATGYNANTIYYVDTGITEDEPEEESEWTGLDDVKALFEEEDNILTSKKVTIDETIPSGTTRYYVYFRFSPNLSADTGIRTIIKYLYTYMPCYLVFDMKLNISITQ